MRSAIFPALLLAASSFGDVAAQTAVATNPGAAARAALAQMDGTIMVSGTRAPVEVIRDRLGVPHIYAQNTGDLFFAQGFVVAQDRMWQLEMWRRNGEGRLAEVLGKDYVGSVWFDMDSDGDLDLFVANQGMVDVELMTLRSGQRVVTRMVGVDPGAATARPFMTVRAAR